MSRPKLRNWCAGITTAAVCIAGTLPAGAAPGGYFCDPSGVANEAFGASVRELEDINADGRWEFLAGQPGWTADNGRVLLWFGAAARPMAPDRAWTGSGGERFGASLANIGDVNGGGKADFAVGAPLADLAGTDRGRVYVFYGESLASGTAALQADLIIEGQNGGDNFGWSVSAAGDFDGDGRADFIVGAPRNDSTASDAGAAYVIYGASGGPSANLGNATVLTGEIAGDLFGWSVSDAGNFLAGSGNCVAVGAPSNNTHGGMDGGAVYVYRGRTDGGAPDSVADFTGGTSAAAAAFGQYGFAVRNAGRWNADAYDDLAVGAPYSDAAGNEAGRVEIIFGAASPSTTGDRYANGEVALNHFGWSLARAHNVLGTSAEDVLIGAPGSNIPAADAGRAYIFRGGQASQETAANLDIYADVPLRAGTEAGDLYGTAVASAGDFDGDGIWDLAIAAPAGNSEPSGAVSGFVHLLHSSTGPVAAQLQSWRAAWVPGAGGGQVDVAFALSEPAGAIARIDLSRCARDAQGRPLTPVSVWSGPAADGAARVGILACDGSSYRFLDAGPVGVPDGGSLAYTVTATTTDGRTLPLGELAGPSGRMPAWGLAVGAFPNPSSAAPALSFRALPGDRVTVNIFDVRGRLVRHLLDGEGTGAFGPVAWDGLDLAGRPVAGGVYFLCAHSSEGTRSLRLTMVR